MANLPSTSEALLRDALRLDAVQGPPSTYELKLQQSYKGLLMDMRSKMSQTYDAKMAALRQRLREAMAAKDKIHGQQVETLENHGHQLEQRMVQLLALCSSQQETIKHVEARNKDLQGQLKSEQERSTTLQASAQQLSTQLRMQQAHASQAEEALSALQAQHHTLQAQHHTLSLQQQALISQHHTLLTELHAMRGRLTAGSSTPSSSRTASHAAASAGTHSSSIHNGNTDRPDRSLAPEAQDRNANAYPRGGPFSQGPLPESGACPLRHPYRNAGGPAAAAGDGYYGGGGSHLEHKAGAGRFAAGGDEGRVAVGEGPLDDYLQWQRQAGEPPGWSSGRSQPRYRCPGALDHQPPTQAGMAASGITSHSYNKAYPIGFPIQEPQYIQARRAAMQRSPWDQTQLPLGEALYELSTSTASSPGPCQQQQQQREQQRQMQQNGDEDLDGSGSTPTSKSYNEPSLADGVADVLATQSGSPTSKLYAHVNGVWHNSQAGTSPPLHPGERVCLRCSLNDRLSPGTCCFHPALLEAPGPLLHSLEWTRCKVEGHTVDQPGCYERTGHFYAAAAAPVLQERRAGTTGGGQAGTGAGNTDQGSGMKAGGGGKMGLVPGNAASSAATLLMQQGVKGRGVTALSTSSPERLAAKLAKQRMQPKMHAAGAAKMPIAAKPSVTGVVSLGQWPQVPGVDVSSPMPRPRAALPMPTRFG